MLFLVLVDRRLGVRLHGVDGACIALGGSSTSLEQLCHFYQCPSRIVLESGVHLAQCLKPSLGHPHPTSECLGSSPSSTPDSSLLLMLDPERQQAMAQVILASWVVVQAPGLDPWPWLFCQAFGE